METSTGSFPDTLNVMDTSSCLLRAVVRSNVTAYRTFVIGAETVGATAGARSARCATAASATDMIAAAVAAASTSGKLVRFKVEGWLRGEV